MLKQTVLNINSSLELKYLTDIVAIIESRYISEKNRYFSDCNQPTATKEFEILETKKIKKLRLYSLTSVFCRQILILLMFLFFSNLSAANELFIYQAANGEKVVTDRKLNISGYELIFYSGSSEKTANALKSENWRNNNFEREISNASKLYGLDIALIKAVIKVESNFNPKAVSPKGAKGLMQLMPATAQQYNVYNLFDPTQNIAAGSKHLRYLMAKFNNNIKLALAAYNAGEQSVLKYNGIPQIGRAHV